MKLFQSLKIKTIILLVFLILKPTCILSSLFEKIHMDYNIGNMNINSICQDNKGLIWIASLSGLYYYDGFKLSSLSLQNQDDIKHVRSIIYDSKKNVLWFLQNNQLASFDIETEKSSKFQDIFNCIALKNDGLWLTRQNNIYTKKNDSSIEFFFKIDQADIIISILEINNKLYVGTLKSGVYVIDVSTMACEKILSNRNIVNFYEDSDNHIWICSDSEGLFEIFPDNTIKHYSTDTSSEISLSSNYIRNIIVENESIWIGTNDGVNCYNKQTKETIYYGVSDEQDSGLSGASIWSMIKDIQGSIWIATYTADIYIFNSKNDIYKSLITKENTLGREPILGSIIKDKHEKLWIASEWNGLFSYSLTDNKITQYKKSTSGIGSDNISSLYYDEQYDKVWIGCYLGGINSIDIKTGKIEKIKSEKFPQLSNTTISCLCKIADDICFSSSDGIYSYSYNTGTIELLHPLLNNFYTQFSNNNDSIVWAADYNKLVRFNLKNGEYKKYQFISNDNNGVQFQTTISSIYIDESINKIWLTSRGSGLICFDVINEEFKIYSTKNSQLLSNVTYAFLPIRQGYYLISTNNGLSLFDYRNNYFSTYTHEKGLKLTTMVPGGMYHDNKRDIYLSGKEGLFLVDKSQIFSESELFDINFSELWVNYNKVYSGDNTGILNKNISETKDLSFNHNQNIISFKFSTNNFVKTNNIIYEFMLDGFDKKWSKLTKTNEINYMNLSPGNYVLRVKGYNQNQPNTFKEISLNIRVYPHPLLSWWAICVYIIITVVVIICITKAFQTHMKMKYSIYAANQEKKQIEIANQSKLHFFTNIAHEFRTPITLIIGQLQLVLESNIIPYILKKQVLSIYKQALQMQELVTELIDFRKHEQGFLILNYSEESLPKFVEEIYLSFKEQAKLKKIDLIYQNDTPDVLVWYDAIQLKKVLNNVVLNAIKYTSDGGEITIKTSNTQSCFSIYVEDNGIGIPKDQIEKIFDRFYRVEQLSEESNSYISSGIGLALTKSIVEAHGGDISINSQIGIGSVVKINIPHNFSDLETKGMIRRVHRETEDEKSITNLVDYDFKNDANDINRIIENLNSNISILIVEDNEELRNLLQQIFSQFINVICATDGEDGWQMLLEHKPDLVLSDHLMPKLSGIELCKRIKNSSEWCHTPIILLTACSSPEQNIDGLKSGADDYITKPFNINILLTRCMTLLLNRQLLRKKFSEEIDVQPITIASNITDQQFIEEAFKIIEQNLENESFTIPNLAKELLISQSTLANKIKALTGKTPLEFVLTVKLRKGAELLLKMPQEKILVIANNVGFTNPKYFASCFKEQFGITPTEYRRKKGF